MQKYKYTFFLSILIKHYLLYVEKWTLNTAVSYVGLSVLLSWSLVTFQPFNYRQISPTEKNYNGKVFPPFDV